MNYTKIAWWFLGVMVAVLATMVIVINRPAKDDGDGVVQNATPKVKWPRAYMETVNPDHEEFVYPGEDEWLAEPVHVPKSHWGWFNFVDQDISDDRMYVRCANAPEDLDDAEVILWNINSPKEIFVNTGCRYFDMKLPPDTKVGNPVVSFRISKMR